MTRGCVAIIAFIASVLSLDPFVLSLDLGTSEFVVRDWLLAVSSRNDVVLLAGRYYRRSFRET